MWGAGIFTLRNLLRAVGAVLLALGLVGLVGLPSVGAWVWFLLFLAGAVVASLSLLTDRISESKDADQAQKFADLHGWRYERQLPGLFAQLRTPPFNVMRRNYVHVVRGTYQGLECFDGIAILETQVDGELTVAARYRIAAVRLPDDLPTVLLQPEGLSTTLAKLFGGGDRDFESAEFNKKWRVQCADARVAHDMLSPRVLERLERIANPAPMLFEAGFGVRIDDESVDQDTLAERLDGLIAVARFVPQHTMDDHGKGILNAAPLPSSVIPGALTSGFRPDILEADEAARKRQRQRPQN